MGVLNGVEVSFDSLIGYSKLQDILELFLEHLNAQELAIQPLQAAAAELKEGQQVALEQLQTAQVAIQEQQALQTAAGAAAPQQLEELTSRLDRQEELIRQLQADASRQTEMHDAAVARLESERAQEREERMQEREAFFSRLQEQQTALAHLQENVGGPSGVSSLLEDVRREVQNIQSKEEARQMAMPKPGEELPPEIRAGIATALGPLEAAIAALDARIESQVAVRLELHETRLDAHERVHENLFASAEGALSRGRSPSPSRVSAWPDGEEQVDGKHATIVAVKQEISDLSRKLSEVISVLGQLETQVQEQGGPARVLNSGSRDLDPVKLEYAEMLNKASRQLEDRVQSLESKLAEGSAGDMSQFGDSLKQVQSVATNLEGIVSQDVQPTLDTHTSELRRFAGELSDICRRINNMVTKTSMVTTTGQPHCLACYDERRQATNKVIIGRDGKTYLQGNSGPTINLRSDVSSYSTAWSSEDRNSAMVSALAKPRLAGGDRRLELQGGAGAPLRKYRIPTGSDGAPTWNMVKGTSAVASTGSLPAAVERGRGAQRGLPMAAGSRPMSSPGLGVQTSFARPGREPIMVPS